MAISAATAMPLAHADAQTRVGYLQRVAALTLLGLVVAGMTGFLSAGAIAVVPALQGQWASLGIMFGAYAVAHWVAPGMVFSGSSATRWLGFMVGSVFQGIAMGYLLLVAIVVSQASLGSPLLLIGQALGLTSLTAVGITAYLWSRPRDLSLIKAGLAAMFLPMMLLMVLTLVFPVGGPLGIALSALFVAISAAGLLYRMNEVLHTLRSDMHVEGAYMVTMGVLVLFWNLLTLLMRLQDRR